MHFRDSADANKIATQVPITPTTFNPKTQALAFGEGRVDTPTTSVRSFIDGVKTNDGFLDLNLVHSGQETIIDEKGDTHDFDHQPARTNFRHKIADKDYTGPGTVSGTVSTITDDAEYAMVGPFTTWHVMTNKNNNPGLDLSDAKDPYLEA